MGSTFGTDKVQPQEVSAQFLDSEIDYIFNNLFKTLQLNNLSQSFTNNVDTNSGNLNERYKNRRVTDLLFLILTFGFLICLVSF